ncbi:MAG TPA: tRNA pseudouridine(13) synthase TruD [Thermoplasmata archaeon]|jgi:tRNA pseudouridine13 synthase|nr:MAG TPA: tRNA pseudouridine(13) synthase TruD [Thermoplasmata archaeon]
MKTPDFEHEIGIDTYYTNQPGIGGKIRVRIDDFHVTELFLRPPEKEAGNFTIAEVSCRNWETHTLVNEIADRLHFSQRRVSFAGTKDKRAWTTQLMSFDHVSSEQLSRLNIKDVVIENIYQSDVPVRIGDLLGNRFEITVRNIEEAIVPEQIKTLVSPFNSWGGFPNFYGIQRFGIIRPITHLVGKYIVQGDFEKAAMTYVAHPMVGENETTFALRAELEKTRDYGKAFHSYPDSLNFEKAMLNKLIQNPKDFTGAFKELPKNLLLMFVNAYESILFNKILSERLRRKIPIHQAIVGDVIFPVRKTIVTNETIPVTASNIDKVNRQISKKKAVVTGLLVGCDTVFADGEMGEIEHAVIDAEKIDLRDFIIPEIPFLSSSGSRRALLALMPSLEWTLHTDELFKEHQALTLRFELQKGCYATCLLREIMKSNNPKNY